MKLKLITLLLLLAPSAGAAREAVVTLRATVVGNREQPRVMYILPWQQPEGANVKLSPADYLAQDLYQAIDREEFLRELDYRAKLAAPTEQSDTIHTIRSMLTLSIFSVIKYFFLSDLR